MLNQSAIGGVNDYILYNWGASREKVPSVKFCDILVVTIFRMNLQLSITFSQLKSDFVTYFDNKMAFLPRNA
jgi:hypothetical protein